MPRDRAAPTPLTITAEAFDYILSLYPDILKFIYQTKVKADDERREQAFADDAWRYETFPRELQSRGVDIGFTLKELERLVRWKITHQKNRPFLLSQIRKNDDRTVKACTAATMGLLGASGRSSSTVEVIRSALDKICELKGVGPATGTLILSVFRDEVPFFEDELYAWLLSDSNAKLKYNVKEYFDLLDTLRDVMSRKDMARDARAFEKVAYVCEHWDHLDDTDKTHIAKLMEDDTADKPTHKGISNTAAAKPSMSQETEEAKIAPNSMSRDKRSDKRTQARKTDDKKAKRKLSVAETTTAAAAQRTKRSKG